MIKKKLYKLTILLGILIGVMGIISLFIIYSSEVIDSLNNIKGAWFVLIIILIKIGILSGMVFYLFLQWFKQEKQYLSDIPFLFGLFFLFLIFGKFLDILFNLTFFTLDEESVLFLLKVRYFVAILTLFPMMYLSIGMIIYYLSLKERFKKLRDAKYSNKISGIVLTIIVFIESIAIIIAPNTTIMGILLPCFVVPSVITIVWIFAFAYKNKRLSQAHPLILAIGFFLLLISQILRPLAQNVLGDSAEYIIFVELFDLFTYILIIFLGLILKVKYKSN